MSEFLYLPEVIAVIFFEFFFILAIYRYRCRCKCKCYRNDSIHIEDESNFDGIVHNKRDIVLFRFEDTYESFLPGLKYILFITRFLSLCFIGGAAVVGNIQNYYNSYL